MHWALFWKIHAHAYRVCMWIVSIKFGMLGLFCLLFGFWKPVLFLFAPVCLALCAIANPWIVRR